MGQFNVKDPAKDTKKRRGAPLNVNTLGAPIAGSSADASRMGDLQSNRAGSVQAVGMAKVSFTVISALHFTNFILESQNPPQQTNDS